MPGDDVDRFSGEVQQCGTCEHVEGSACLSFCYGKWGDFDYETWKDESVGWKCSLKREEVSSKGEDVVSRIIEIRGEGWYRGWQSRM